ncbi:MAG: LLM class flavin-dependent oxidoreductase [Chloroflexi bacterium]|nr:LLM class flavin-dependent oxidoreductase [Chloroflexota bacterium]
MKIGLIPPEGYFDEFEGWPATRAWDRILHIAQRAEALGFDSLWFGEHVLAKWNRQAPIFDFFTLSTAIAAAVPRIAIGFCVVNSTFRNPALTAKMAATLDAISHGRLILGLGAGFKVSEAEAWGVPYPDTKERLAILSEHLEIISRLTRAGEPPFTFEGRYARVSNLGGAPHGAQKPRIPLLIGGHGRNVTMRLAAKYCDEIGIDLSLEGMPAGLAVLRDRCDEIGRDPATLAINVGTHPAFPYKGLRVTGNQRMMAQEDLPAVMCYDLDALTTRADELIAWKEMGVDRITCGAAGLADTDEALDELVEDLGKAGLTLDRSVPGATLVAEGRWLAGLPESAEAAGSTAS